MRRIWRAIGPAALAAGLGGAPAAAQPASGLTRYDFLHSTAPGSLYFFLNGTEPGSAYFWRYGQTQGSRYFWARGTAPWSSYFWTHGDGRWSAYYWTRASLPGGAYYWRSGPDCLSLYRWNNGSGAGQCAAVEQPALLTVHCLAGVLDIEPCAAIGEAILTLEDTQRRAVLARIAEIRGAD